MTDLAVSGAGEEKVVIGAVGGVGFVGIPEVGHRFDVFAFVDEASPSVIDKETRRVENGAPNQTFNCENIIISVTVWSNDIGKTEIYHIEIEGIDAVAPIDVDIHLLILARFGIRLFEEGVGVAIQNLGRRV